MYCHRFVFFFLLFLREGRSGDINEVENPPYKLQIPPIWKWFSVFVAGFVR